MTSKLTSSVLDEARGAQTSGEMTAAIEKIAARLEALKLDKDALERNLQDAIVAGKDVAKVQASIASNEQEAALAQKAIDGFSARRDEMAKTEKAQEKLDLIASAKSEAEQLKAATEKAVELNEAEREAWAKVAEHARQLERMNGQLEAEGERRLTMPSAVISAAVGTVPHPSGVTEYGRRLDLALLEVLSDRPNILRRRANTRRGRFGESNAAKDQYAGAPMAS